MTTQTLAVQPHLTIINGEVKTTSLKVAEHFGKRHGDVIRALEGIECSKEFNQRNFALVKYTDAKGEQRPMYEMTKDGFVFLAMGFTGKQAAHWKEAYINAFNAMERQILANTLPTPERIALLENTVKRYHDRYNQLFEIKEYYTIPEVAKLLTQQPRAFAKFMERIKWIHKGKNKSGRWYANQAKIDSGHLVQRLRSDPVYLGKSEVLITFKGLDYLQQHEEIESNNRKRLAKQK